MSLQCHHAITNFKFTFEFQCASFAYYYFFTAPTGKFYNAFSELYRVIKPDRISSSDLC